MIRQWSRVWTRERTSIRGFLEGSPSEITSHARPVARSTGSRRKRERGEADSGRAASGGEKKEKGRGKTRRRVTILLSFLYPQKSRFSAGASNNERTEPSLSPYTLLLCCHFRLVYFSISPVYVCVYVCSTRPARPSESLDAQKAVKAIKVPESSARGEAR